MRDRRRAVIFFSNVIDSPIYRSIIKSLIERNWAVTYFFFGKETEKLVRYAENLGLEVIYYQNFTRSKSVFYIFKICLFIFRIKPKITFTFGQTATLIGLFASVISSSSTRMYLRMHTSMNKVEKYRFGPYYDRVSNYMANKIIVPNRNTKDYLINSESVKNDLIEIIEFGFELNDYKYLSNERKQAFAMEYNLNKDFFYIGIASRFASAKGLEYSIPAISKLIGEYPNIKLLVAGVGNQVSTDFQLLLKQIPIDNYLLIDRVYDMAAFYSCINIFVHTPIDSTVESFGLVYIEALAAGVPCVFTLSGIANDIAINEENCLVVDYKNKLSIYEAVKRIFIDQELAFRISSQSPIDVSKFSMEKMCNKYIELFEANSNPSIKSILWKD